MAERPVIAPRVPPVQTSLLEPDGPARGTSPAKAAFLEGLLATWLALADDRSTPTAEQRRRGRAAADVALAELHRPV
jgi:hypothetical protein